MDARKKQILNTKIKLVLDNYFPTDCNINTTIREAYERGFRRGIEKCPDNNDVNFSDLKTGDKYIVEVIGNGIRVIEPFDEEKWIDRDGDLDMLTEAEKESLLMDGGDSEIVRTRDSRAFKRAVRAYLAEKREDFEVAVREYCEDDFYGKEGGIQGVMETYDNLAK